jgi:hypothetical protein
VRKRFVELGFVGSAETPAEFAAAIDAEIPFWARLIKQSGAKPDH